MISKINIRFNIFLFLLFIFFAASNNVIASPAKVAVENTYRAWCAAISTAKGNPHKIIKFYAHDAILLPTLSPKILLNSKSELNSYFKHFTSHPNIKCTTNKLITRVYDNVAINSGLYTFSYTDHHGKTKAIPARFTFVYIKQNNQWLIIKHHSSKLPED